MRAFCIKEKCCEAGNYTIKHLVVSLLLAGFAVHPASGQYPNVPTVNTPKPATFQQYGVFPVPSSPRPNIPQSSFDFNRSIQERNERMFQEDMKQMELQRQMQQRQMQEAMNEFEPRRGINIAVCKSVIPLPDFSSEPETEHFHNAFGEMNKMLTGEVPISIKDAVFLAENAYWGNQLSYTDYNNAIKQAAGLCRAKMRQQGLNPEDNDVKNMMAFHYMADTFKLKLAGREQSLIHYPMKYDFEDFYGRKDIRKHFVTKLLAENSGQCHSLPELFLIMSEELGSEAYLSRSPEHTFVKIKDNSGHWYNLELTCGAIFNDQQYLGNSFIKAEALRNKIYLEPMTRQQTVAQIMVDLATYYIRKYGYDGFVKQCIDTALKYYPNCLSAHMMHANYHTARAMYVIERTGVPSVEKLAECPQAYSMYQTMHQSYTVLDDLGYEDMPPDAYADWLNRVNKEKEKPENQRTKWQLQQVIK